MLNPTIQSRRMRQYAAKSKRLAKQHAKPCRHAQTILVRERSTNGPTRISALCQECGCETAIIDSLEASRMKNADWVCAAMEERLVRFTPSWRELLWGPGRWFFERSGPTAPSQPPKTTEP